MIPDLQTLIQEAESRVHQQLAETPLVYSHPLSAKTGREVFIKWDNKHPTGSFKERGACNFLGAITEKGVSIYSASAGNHALAVARHSARLGFQATIVMPRYTPLVKVERTRDLGAQVILKGDSFDDALKEATRLSDEAKGIFIPAFDHELIIAGQATLGSEVLKQLSDFDAIIVPVGGGGLLAGVSSVLKAARPKVKIFGVRSKWAEEKRLNPALSHGLVSPSLADGIAVKRIGALTEPILKKNVDEFFIADENDIANAIVTVLEEERAVVEGAGASGLVPLLDGSLPSSIKRVVVPFCGSNIDISVLARLIDRNEARKGRLFALTVSVPDRPGALHKITATIAKTNANIVNIMHDRYFSDVPGHVDIHLRVEIMNAGHQREVVQALEEEGFVVEERVSRDG